MINVLVTGGFDPLHSGHIQYFKAARQLGGRLIVGLNSDEWLQRKKGKAFMPWDERKVIIEELGCVDKVIEFDDKDDTACHAIYTVLKYNRGNDELIFANGGDRGSLTTPEMKMYKDQHALRFAFEVGSSIKQNSSSWILREWTQPKTYRDWGYYRVLHEDGRDTGHHTKVKELTVEPGLSLSQQRHSQRNEHWIVTEGTASLELEKGPIVEYNIHETIEIPAGMWHRLSNRTNNPLRIVEIQYGSACIESDIERAPIEEQNVLDPNGLFE